MKATYLKPSFPILADATQHENHSIFHASSEFNGLSFADRSRWSPRQKVTRDCASPTST